MLWLFFFSLQKVVGRSKRTFSFSPPPRNMSFGRRDTALHRARVHWIGRTHAHRTRVLSPPTGTMAACVVSTAPVRSGRAPRVCVSAKSAGKTRLGIQCVPRVSVFGGRAGASHNTRTRSLPENADALLLEDGEGLLARISIDVDCVVLDCDGVIWQGDTLLPGAKESIELLRQQGKRLVFVTNNSNKSRAQYVHKFEQMGIHVEKGEVFSAAFAAAAYLKTKKFTGKAFVVGGRGIVDELNDMQIRVDPGVFHAVACTEADWEDLVLDDEIGAVIVGQDMAFTFAKLAYASLAIQVRVVFPKSNDCFCRPSLSALLLTFTSTGNNYVHQE